MTRSIFSAFVFSSATSSLCFRSSRLGPIAAKQWKPHENFREKYQFSVGQMVLQHLSTLLHSSCCHWALSPLQNKHKAKNLLDRRTAKVYSIAEARNLPSCLSAMRNNCDNKSHCNGTHIFSLNKCWRALLICENLWFKESFSCCANISSTTFFLSTLQCPFSLLCLIHECTALSF